MKTPKYRAWIKDKHKMVDVCCLGIIEGKPYIISYGNNPYSWYEFELMEFIGLKDKKGREIYEGDLVKYTVGDSDPVIDIVCYNKEYACFGLKDDTGDFLYSFDWILGETKLDDIEIVGNIYENKDLLGE